MQQLVDLYQDNGLGGAVYLPWYGVSMKAA